MSEPGDSETPAGSSKQGEGILGNLRPRSEAVTKAVEKRKEAMDEGELVESPGEQKIRHAKSHEERLKAREEQKTEPVVQETSTETPQQTKEIDTEKTYDVFFRDKDTHSPNRLHKNIGQNARGEAETEPVILPQIPDNWIVTVPVGLGGGEALYRQSSPEDAKKTKKRVGLGNITTSNREIMMLDVVLKDDVSGLKEKGYKVVHIDNIPQELGKTEKVELPIAA